MKTQLLEDIGHSASLSLVPSGRESDFRSHQGAQRITQAPVTKPAKPRPAFGVWKARPAGEPVDFAPQQQKQPLPPVEILPVVAQIAVTDALETSPPQAYEAAISPAEPTPEPVATMVQSEPAPPDPVFDFSPSTPAPLAADPFTQKPTWLKRSGQRYVLGGVCALSVALIALAGVWLYGERKGASTLALVADASKAQAQSDIAAQRRAVAAKEFTLSPDGEVRVAPAAPASTPAPVPTPAPPPSLVLLEPEPVPAPKVEPVPVRAAVRAQRQASPKPERVAAKAPAAPLPRRVRQTAREQLNAAAKPARSARTRAERAADRQVARTPVTPVARKTEQESSKDATLKACKEYGYSAAQCVKRACSVTKYGFVCRGK